MLGNLRLEPLAQLYRMIITSKKGNFCWSLLPSHFWKNGQEDQLLKFEVTVGGVPGVLLAFVFDNDTFNKRIYYSPASKKWGYTGFVLSFRGSVIIQMKLEYLWGQLANLDQILSEASLGWGKGCIRFWDRLDQNWFPWQQKTPIDLQWGKRYLHLHLFKLAGNKDRHKISDKFEFRPDRTIPYRVRCLEHLKNFP